MVLCPHLPGGGKEATEGTDIALGVLNVFYEDSGPILEWAHPDAQGLGVKYVIIAIQSGEISRDRRRSTAKAACPRLEPIPASERPWSSGRQG